ncbi:MAG: hypothetical protein JSV86_14320 [Gemmatimonadota bacterium]|nr:MAG: hypothetical protein JSV86_14320 [Gemmatimonadota bacterium]
MRSRSIALWIALGLAFLRWVGADNIALAAGAILGGVGAGGGLSIGAKLRL